jgi:general secretion pathway protein A
MYKQFFGLRANPFNVNPDPRYLYLTPHAVEALASLTYGIQSRQGFIVLTGEVGTGKTTLINKLLDWLHSQKFATAFVFNSKIDVAQLFDFIMADFGIPCESRQKSLMLLRLNEFFLNQYRVGHTSVLVIDEAQNLSLDVLEEIRLLTNMETPTQKLLQIVLAGQPELEENLNLPQLRQLRQRIRLRCKTEPLTPEETGAYIAQRLRVAGRNGQPIFTGQALQAIHRYAQGIPRVINLLCHHALISAFADQMQQVNDSIIKTVAHEFELEYTNHIAAVARANGNGTDPNLIEVLRSSRNLSEGSRWSRQENTETHRKGGHEPNS